MAEAFAVFVQFWFTHTLGIGENEKKCRKKGGLEPVVIGKQE